MDHYVTGAAIKQLREGKKLTQAQLAEALQVSDKAVSKWETGRGLPDITLLEPLAAALGVSVPELLSGRTVVNRNRSANVLKSKFYVCPVCGNVIHTTGEAMVSSARASGGKGKPEGQTARVNVSPRRKAKKPSPAGESRGFPGRVYVHPHPQ